MYAEDKEKLIDTLDELSISLMAKTLREETIEDAVKVAEMIVKLVNEYSEFKYVHYHKQYYKELLNGN